MISFLIKMNFILSLLLFDVSKGLKNVETAVVNKPSVFEKGENRYPLWHYL